MNAIKKNNFINLPLSFYLILVIGAISRLYHLGFQSFWLDEFINFFDATHPFHKIHSEILASPPLFHYVVRCFYLIFGKNDFWLRFPAALFGIATVGFLFMAVDCLYERKAAIWASLLYALSPMAIVYSQELRMYSLLPLLSLGAVFCWELAMRQNRSIYWVGFSIFSIFGLYTHNWFPFLIASMGIWSGMEWTIKKSWSLRGIASFIFVALLYLPWIPVLREQMNKNVYDHMTRPSLSSICEVFYAFAGIRVPSGHSWVGVGTTAIVPLFIISVTFFFLGLRNKSVLRIFFVGLFLPLVSVFLVSRWCHPVFIANRYTVMFLPVYCIVISQAFCMFKNINVIRLNNLFQLFWLCSCVFVIGEYYFYFQKAPWKSMVQWMNHNHTRNERINYSALDYNRIAFNYYIPALAELSDLNNIDDGSFAYIPVRNTGIAKLIEHIPPNLEIEATKNFSDYSVLTVKAGFKK